MTRTLFDDLDPVPPAASHKPTSVAAAAKIAGDPARRQRALILDWLRREGGLGMTRQEIEHATFLPGDSVRPRVLELIEAGLVRETDRTRKTTKGRDAAVLVAVPQPGE
jgi:hypothetical protein